jgi:hypothetical protein
LGNGGDGVAILAFQYGYNNLIGGTDPGAGNTIAYNGGYGVRITTGTGNAIRENAIFANAAGGIKLLNGANDHRVAPTLTSAVIKNGTLTVAGTVAGIPGETSTLDFFDNPVRARRGEAFLGSLTVTVGIDGHGSLAFQVSGGVYVGDFVTGTATDAAGNTSRFSKPVQVTGTDTAAGNLNGAPGLTGLTSTVPPAVRSADDPASTVARPLSQEVSTSPSGVRSDRIAAEHHDGPARPAPLDHCGSQDRRLGLGHQPAAGRGNIKAALGEKAAVAAPVDRRGVQP